MSDAALLAGLFFSALAASTLLPGVSEAALVGMLTSDVGTPALLVGLASAGNVAGSCINYVIGRSVERFRDRRWFPVSAAGYARAEAWFQRYGYWSLLFVWLPAFGDGLTVVAGALNVGFKRFVVLVTIGKALRYIAVAAMTLWWVDA
ncbi:MAG: YqaA family protein [Rhodospirillaceae bacterium]|nr:YqaA family protein [Rhodospirillaceae bacterium]